jgi:hypothetical protein
MIVWAIKFDNKYYDCKGGLSTLEDCAFWGDFQELASLQNEYIKKGKNSIISFGKIIKVKIEELEEV